MSGAAKTTAALDEPSVRELLRLTHLMVTAAHSDDWSAVTRYDRSRRELLSAAPVNTAEALPAALVEALIAADQALLERTRRVRDTVVDDTRRVRAERDARDSYTRVMSDTVRNGA